MSATRTWSPSGVVTLLTDFGEADTYVGVMKGVLCSRAPRLRQVVDLSHLVPPQNVRNASFHLAHAWRWFPEGTVHVAVVDPGVGTPRPILVARDRGHVFLAPDNGLLGPVLSPDAEVRALDLDLHGLPERSSTFHGRDVFVPTAAAFVEGADPLASGAPIADWRRDAFPDPVDEGGAWSGEVLCIDHFGNAITNLPASALAGDPEAWALVAGGDAYRVRRTYGAVERGEVLGLVDSYGLLELAVRDGSAARTVGLTEGAPMRLERHG